jgi:hypothetical protein
MTQVAKPKQSQLSETGFFPEAGFLFGRTANAEWQFSVAQTSWDRLPACRNLLLIQQIPVRSMDRMTLSPHLIVRRF